MIEKNRRRNERDEKRRHWETVKNAEGGLVTPRYRKKILFKNLTRAQRIAANEAQDAK